MISLETCTLIAAHKVFTETIGAYAAAHRTLINVYKKKKRNLSLLHNTALTFDCPRNTGSDRDVESSTLLLYINMW